MPLILQPGETRTKWGLAGIEIRKVSRMVEEQVDFMIMNDTSQMAMQIDPRSEVEPIAKEAD